MSQELIEKLNSISEDFEKAIIAKCDELGYDKNKGVISLEETFINLNSIKDALHGALDSDKLAQFPISFQNEAADHLENVLKYGTALVNGTDSIINLADSVESLNALLWQYGFYQMSTGELELTKRINKAKFLEVELAQKKEILEALLAKKEDVSKIQEEIATQNDESQKLSDAIAETLKNSKSLLTQLQTAKENADETLTALTETKDEAEKELAESKESKTAVSKIQELVETFFGKIDGYQKKIDTVTSKADTTVENNNTQISSLAKKLEQLQISTQEQLVNATGISLFHTFEKRKLDIAKSKRVWSYVLLGLVLGSVALSLVIGFTSKNIDLWLYVKLSFTLPVAYAIAFVNVQYSKERRLEEEYAFKSNISLSLVPYKELIEKTIDKEDSDSRKKYNEFLIQMIEKIFTSPTDGITSHTENDPAKTLENLGKSLESIVKPLQPLLKAIRP